MSYTGYGWEHWVLQTDLLWNYYLVLNVESHAQTAVTARLCNVCRWQTQSLLTAGICEKDGICVVTTGKSYPEASSPRTPLHFYELGVSGNLNELRLQLGTCPFIYQLTSTMLVNKIQVVNMLTSCAKTSVFLDQVMSFKLINCIVLVSSNKYP